MKLIYKVVEQVHEAFESDNIPFVVGGTFANAVAQNPLDSRILEVSAYLASHRVESVTAALEKTFLLNREEIRDCVVSSDTFRFFELIDVDSLFKVNVHLSHNEPYDAEVFRRASIQEILPNIRSNCMSAEDIVIQKLRWFELGNRVSDRQWNDIVQVLEVQKGLLDETYLDKWATHFEVKELLDEARRQIL
ncbi:hypothetical protein BH11ARM1_BH11ARM1_06020 [soil metagenome]